MKRILSAAFALQMMALPVFAQGPTKTSTAGREAVQTSRGGADPGGGAYVKVNGRSQLLAEAGLIADALNRMPSKKRPQIYTISEETIEQLQKILGVLPPIENPEVWGTDGGVLATRDTFFKQDDMTPAEYAVVNEAYKRAMIKLGRGSNKLPLIFAAYSQDGKTNVLPAFDELVKDCEQSQPCWAKLSPEEKKMTREERKAHGHFQQALILIHEYWMRRRVTIGDKLLSMAEKLERIFRLDAVIYQIATRGRTTELMVKYYDAIEGLHEEAVPRWLSLGMRFKELFFKLNRPVEVSEFFLEYSSMPPTRFAQDVNDVEPMLVQNFESQIPGIADHFAGARFKTDLGINFGSGFSCESTLLRMGFFFRENENAAALRLYRNPLIESIQGDAKFCSAITANLQALCDRYAKPRGNSQRQVREFLTYESSSQSLFYVSCTSSSPDSNPKPDSKPEQVKWVPAGYPGWFE